MAGDATEEASGASPSSLGGLPAGRLEITPPIGGVEVETSGWSVGSPTALSSTFSDADLARPGTVEQQLNEQAVLIEAAVEDAAVRIQAVQRGRAARRSGSPGGDGSAKIEEEPGQAGLDDSVHGGQDEVRGDAENAERATAGHTISGSMGMQSTVGAHSASRLDTIVFTSWLEQVVDEIVENVLDERRLSEEEEEEEEVEVEADVFGDAAADAVAHSFTLSLFDALGQSFGDETAPLVPQPPTGAKSAFNRSGIGADLTPPASPDSDATPPASEDSSEEEVRGVAKRVIRSPPLRRKVVRRS